MNAIWLWINLTTFDRNSKPGVFDRMTIVTSWKGSIGIFIHSNCLPRIDSSLILKCKLVIIDVGEYLM